ncbi:MAG TPA: hypothetical protein VK568_15780 [Thermodesulfobacteriota bacterium]|nr:hypothetical protein [Thermodesulfobacteriota bacterium]
MNDRITDLPFDEIANWYPKGMIPWLKRNHLDKWGELLSIEKELNGASFDLDEQRTAELLAEYRDFVKSMADEFESRKRGQGKTYFITKLYGCSYIYKPPLFKGVMQAKLMMFKSFPVNFQKSLEIEGLIYGRT